MIFDRTQNDVDAAIRLRNEKVQTFQELTESEIATLEKGTLTINTLNRIETKQEELKNLFNDMGYWNTNTSNRNWNYNDIFDEENFQRILKNCEILKKAFYTFLTTPDIPNVSYDYMTFNSLEKILFDLETMSVNIKSKYRKSGTFKSGEASA